MPETHGIEPMKVVCAQCGTLATVGWRDPDTGHFACACDEHSEEVKARLLALIEREHRR